ncbi:barH-like 1 homeobox protein [Paramacrobiotus metropolitanus]|uniref:barH-like 1 homeobox protein n=1 Tax=Paramacrobiotus metropolitanus TaxID=2943436 RepID=UPI0024456916|nr:barH-like 1 homeobox protein [Paramacrobiotus metropolitanus]
MSAEKPECPVDYSQSKFSIDFLLQRHDTGGHPSAGTRAQRLSPSPTPSMEAEDPVAEGGREGAGSRLSRHSEPSASDSEQRRKRPRTAFTALQIKTLETEFERNKYLSVAKRVELSKLLGLSQQQLKVWYQNRRTKWKRKFANDLESMAQQYYSSLGLSGSRPMLIGDRLWIFNSPQDVPLNLRRNLLDAGVNASGAPPPPPPPPPPGLLNALPRGALLGPLSLGNPAQTKRAFPLEHILVTEFTAARKF